MWKKSQHKEKNIRIVKSREQAKVFSYYNSRSGQSGNPARDGNNGGGPDKKTALSSFFSGLMFFAVITAFIGCVIYASTLTSTPSVLEARYVKESGNIGADLPSGRSLSEYEADIAGLFERSWTNRSKALIDTEALASDIESRYPELGDVAIVLPLIGRKPVVRVIPAKPVMVLTNGEGAYVLGPDGRILSEASNYDKKLLRPLPVVRDQSGLELKSGISALREETVSFIDDVVTHLEVNDLMVRDATLPFDTPYDLHLRLASRKYYVKFNIKGDSALQAGSLIALEGQEDVNPNQYIDVRVAGKVFYK